MGIQPRTRRESGVYFRCTAQVMQMNARLAHNVIDMGWGSELENEWLPNGLEMSRPASQD